MQDLFRTLPALIREIEGSDEVREAVAFSAWRRVAGGPMADRTTPITLEVKRLVIAVADKAWKRNLEDLSGQMLFKLNAVMGTSLVNFIEFRVDPASIKNSLSAASSAAELEEAERAALAGLAPDLLASAATIQDESMRRTFMLAAANCLARKL